MKTRNTFKTFFNRIFFRHTAVAAALGLLAQSVPAQAQVFKGVAGLELYSVRAQLAAAWPATLDQVRDWGVKYVELAGTCGLTRAQFRAELEKRGLHAVGAHFGFDDWDKDPENAVRQAQESGLEYAGCAWITHRGEFDEAACRKAIDVFNRAGAAAAQQHIQFFYHTHGYEFQPFGDGTLFDLLMRETNPKQVKFEMDIFWVVHGGQDPVKLLAKYPDRFVLMHLKDMRQGTPTGLLTGASDVKNDVALGTGKLDLPAILAEAGKIGIKWYFIEDESPSSIQQIPVSLKYLEKMRQ
jgi:sugar phosphate isomerase/epimerase